MNTAVKDMMGRAARILLVFALVFGCCFHVQNIALADVLHPVSGKIEDHSNDVLHDVCVYEVASDPADDNKTGLGKLAGKASDAVKDEASADDDAQADSDAQTDGDAQADGDSKDEAAKLELQVGQTYEYVAIACWNGDQPAIDEDAGTVEIANFVKWDITCSPAGCASLEVDADNPGKVTVTALAEGKVTVTCELADPAKDDVTLQDEALDGMKVSFELPIEPAPAQVSKRVSELRVLDAQGNLVSGATGSLTLPKASVGAPYTFGVEIKVSVLKGDAETFETYDSLDAARQAGAQVVWSLTSGGDFASITQDGALTLSQEGAVAVHVEASMGSETVPVDFTVKTVGAADPSEGEDPTPGGDDEPTPQPVSQGERNPQQVLTVISNARSSESDDSTKSESGSSNASSAASQDAASSSASSQSDANSSSVLNDGSSSSSSSSSASESEASADNEAATIKKEYTVADLEALGVETQTYTMYDGSEFVTVTGQGPYLIGLLHDIGIQNTDQIESLTFKNAYGTTTTVTWAELESASLYYPSAVQGNFEDTVTVSPIIAINSLVRGLGDGTGRGADAVSSQEAGSSGDGDENASSSADQAGSGSPSSSTGVTEPVSSSSSSSASASSSASSSSSSSSQTQVPDDSADIALVDNTRFRLLLGATSPPRAIVDPGALCNLTTITVNMKPEEKAPEFDTDIDVSIEYVPVPIGSPAVFSALPNTAILNARFDFEWEVSTDNGKTWKALDNGNVQVLRVLTTEERLGNQYRVTMETNATDKNGLENVTVTSKPVTLREGNGFAVVLEYDPPVAGQTAYFQSSIYGAQQGVKISYTWQQSQDGGITWTDIRGRTGSSLAVPTEPVTSKSDSSDGKDDGSSKSGEDEKVVPITYIRVIAEEMSGDKRVAISEAVPLTVHVEGESGSDEPGDDPKKPGDDSDSKDDSSKPKKKQPKVTPVDDITVEPYVPASRTKPQASSSASSATPTAPSATGTSTPQPAPSQLYVSDSVNETVAEQQAAVEDYIEATVPGARWTSLNSAQATGDDVRNILADNPFAPFVFPVGLGIVVAGGVEKLIAFRRETS